LVLAFGAGALISAVSFELFGEGIVIGGAGAVAIGLALGALTFFVCDVAIDRWGAAAKPVKGRAGSSEAGPALALGAFLDGIPEQLGIGLATGGAISVGLLMAIFVSNLPEAIGSASDMREAGRTPRTVIPLWVAVAVVCSLATAVGYGVADIASEGLQGGINGFAAGALLVMLVDSMIPDATAKTGKVAGIATVLGFAVAAALSGASA
jgi:zinc transporter, ZIP family